MDESFTEPPRRSTRRVLLESRRDFESQSPLFHHSVPDSNVARKRKLSSSGSGGGCEGVSEGGGGEGRWGRTERDRIREEDNVTFNRLYTTKHKRARIRSNSGPVAVDTIVPLRRSKREKRLMFSNLNQQEIYHHMINSSHYSVVDFSDDELEPYEKILSPMRRRRRRPGHASPHSSPRQQHPSPRKSVARRMKLRSSALEQSVKADTSEDILSQPVEREEGEGEGEGEVKRDTLTQDSGEREGEREVATDTEENREGEEEEEENGENEEEEEEEEEGRGYYLRKRRPVVYQYQPIIQVVEEDTPPKKRRQRVRRTSGSDSAYYRKSGPAHASRAYQSKGQSSAAVVSRRVRHVAHAHDSSSTSSSGSDSDEARFRRRKTRSMKKSRRQCLPMNFDPADLAQPVVRDRQRIGASLADIDPMNINREVTFDSIGGLRHHVRSLKEMILFPLIYPEIFDRFKIQPPRGVLFFGPPGCGKTLVARALANECSRGGKKVAFFMRKGADCLSKWVGESERQLRLLFDQAYQLRPSIIFFDEIDGLAPVRSTRQDQIHSSIVSTLLALMDGLDSRGEVVVIGATNRIDAIDPALRRPGRFDREFLFPLPSREDRGSIISIHTKRWSPPLKPSFMSQLADHTVGYCGADLKSLCTEATLSALRRTYPQIYETGEKLVLDVTEINITATDFFASLGRIVPTATRSESSCARALSSEVAPLMMRSLRSALELLEAIFNPSWAAVDKARRGITAAVAMETHRLRELEEHIRNLRSSSHYHHSPSLPRPLTGLSRFSTGQAGLSSSQTSRQNSQNSISQVFEASQPDSGSSVYFNMDDVVNEVGGVESITVETDNTENPSGEDAPDNHRATTEIRNIAGSIFESSLITSHPHSLPTLHRPRLLLCGAPGGGQSSHLGPALLHTLEEIPVKVIDLSVVMGTSSCSSEEALVQIFKEAKRVSPSIIYLPRVDTWWDVTTETFRATFTSSLLSLPPSTSLVVVATAECPWRQLCPSLKCLFSLSYETFSLPHPTRDERRLFFSDTLLVKPLLPTPTTPHTSRDTQQHKQLAVAPPPEPRQLNPGELNKMDRHRNSVLRELRIFLREATNKLLAERKFKEFTRPVDPEVVPDYYEIIKEPMDLGTIMRNVDAHKYTLPKQWLEDVDRITKNAVEYNPAHVSESRLLLHRAVALQDMAHSILEHELSEDFEQQCEDIEETYRKLGRDISQTSPLKSVDHSSNPHTALTPRGSAQSHTPSPSRSSTHSSRRGLYERRRSLRVKGLEPEEKGFDYYAASRTPRKQREGESEGVGGEGGEGEGGCEGVGGEREGESDDVLESGYEDDDEREGEGEMREREIREKERIEKRGTSSGRLHGNLADSRMETGESESDPNDEMEEGDNHRGNDLSSGRNATSENSVKRRSKKRRNGNGTHMEPAGSESTVVRIQRNLRRTPRVKLQPFPGNRETRSPVAVRNERCNDDIITSGVHRDICQTRSEDRVNGSFSSPSNYVGGSANSTHRKNRSHSSSVSMETVSRVRSKVIVISDDKNSSVDTGVVAVATGKKSKSVPVAAGDGVGRGGVACDGVRVGREVVCNGVGRPSSDLWLGGGGAEAESAFRDVLVGMETESERERNPNSKSTHSSTGPSRQVSNSKSTPNPTSTTTRQKSNSNPNLKSAPSVSTTTTTTTAHSSSLRRNQSEEEEEERQEIDVDTSKLVAVFDRVVCASAEVSVEVMEKMLSTFNHLVFRYRMRSDRRQLPRDLELAADLFLRQPHPVHDD